MSEPKRVSVRVWGQRLRADADVVKIRIGTLLVLGTYMDSDGSNGHVRESTLATAMGISDRAVREHIAYARERGYLQCVARGHRLGNGETTASTYEATVPDGDSTGTGTLIDTSTGGQLPVENDCQPEDPDTSTGRSEGLNRNGGAPQPEDRRPLYKEDQVLDQLQTKIPPAATRETTEDQRKGKDLDLASVAAEAIEVATGKHVTHTHGQAVAHAILSGRPVGDPPAYLRKAIANEPARWLRFGEPAHDIAYGMLARANGAGPGTRPPDAPPVPEEPRPGPEPPASGEHSPHEATPLDPALKAEILRQIRTGTAVGTPRPAAARIERTPTDKPDLAPDPDADRLTAARNNPDHIERQLRAMAAEKGWAWEAGNRPEETT